MPGMMDTILNLGLNDETVVALSKKHQTVDLLKIAIDDLFKCMEMSLWELKAIILKN